MEEYNYRKEKARKKKWYDVNKDSRTRKKVLQLSDYLISNGYDDINDSLRELTKKHEEFFGKAFLNESI